MAFSRDRHLEADGRREFAPAPKKAVSAVDADYGKDGAVRVHVHAVKPVFNAVRLATKGAPPRDPCAFLGVWRVAVKDAALLVVEPPPENMDEAPGEALGDVATRRDSKAEAPLVNDDRACAVGPDEVR